ncbi:hypothetical protein CEXT_443701 [Caerostris extrusa]|uniref:Uncharacterized protein n=1 Tax=Caerostris extrusa TaxID=172846 RepID=A0AAV4X1B9_CAEEX|nr:hypothetical protein CEXT_443701 [Caerostris extrusa]
MPPSLVYFLLCLSQKKVQLPSPVSVGKENRDSINARVLSPDALVMQLSFLPKWDLRVLFGSGGRQMIRISQRVGDVTVLVREEWGSVGNENVLDEFESVV